MTGKRIKLTIERIKEADCDAGKPQTFYWDTEQRGLGLRLTSNGSKSFVYQGKLNGNTIRMTLGDAGTVPLSSVWEREGQKRTKELQVGARELAARFAAMIAEGRDPREVKARRTAADTAARTEAKRKEAPASEAWEAYIAERAPQWSAKHLRDHEDVYRAGGEPITRGRRKGMKAKKEAGILRAMLSQPLNRITEDMVRDWTKANLKKRPTRTRLALSFLGTFFRWCDESKTYRGAVNADTLKACASEKRKLPQPSARTDCLQREQLAVWFDHVKRLPPVVSAYLQAGLLTGARREELAGLRWADVDMAWNSLTIRDKVEGQRTIPLTPYVKSLLLGLQNLNNQKPSVRYLKTLEGRGDVWKPSPYVFFSRTAKGGRITDPSGALAKVATAAALPSVSMHGLRRSFKSLSEWCEVPAGVVAQIMGHKPSATAEKHYTVRPLDLLRKWHTSIEAWILEQAGIAQPNIQTGRAVLSVVGDASIARVK